VSPVVYVIEGIKHGSRYRQFVCTSNPVRERKEGRLVVMANYLGKKMFFAERKTFVENLSATNVFKKDKTAKVYGKNDAMRLIYESIEARNESSV
jgi:hypothetical protein